MSDLSQDFIRGAWFAFDEVLGWINTRDTVLINKEDLYRQVMKLRPEALWRESVSLADVAMEGLTDGCGSFEVENRRENPNPQ